MKKSILFFNRLLLITATCVFVTSTAQDGQPAVDSADKPNEPIDCFFETPIFGLPADAEGSFTTSDYDLLKRLTPLHKLSAIRVCTDLLDSNVIGVQLSYAIFVEGRFTEEVLLQEHGIIQNIDDAIICQTNDVFEGDYVSEVAIGFTETDLIQFFYSTQQ